MPTRDEMIARALELANRVEVDPELVPPPGVVKTAEFELVNAEIARDYLATQVHNRPPSDFAINPYEADMRAGRWHSNGEAFKFDWNGHLIDGQQRCHALARTLDTVGTPDEVIIEVLVVRGLSPRSQMSMDQGRLRSAGQQLEMLGRTHGAYTAGVVNMVRQFEVGEIFGRRKHSQMTTNALVEWVSEHEEEIGLAISYRTKLRGMAIRPGITGAMLILFYRKSPIKALEFYDAFASGANLPPGSPILALRARLDKALRMRETLTDRDGMFYLIQAWNAWLRGRTLNKMQRPHSEWKPEHFVILP